MKFKRIANVYIINSENKILLLKHKKLNLWLPPGGHVEEDEFTHEAAIREVKEETGLDIEFIYDTSVGIDSENKLDWRATLTPRPLFVQIEDSHGDVNEDFIYFARAVDDRIVNNEGHEIGWFEFEEALELETFENVRKHLRYIEKKLR